MRQDLIRFYIKLTLTSSGDVYIIGQERQDARFDVTDGDTYIKMAMVHLVTPKIDGSSGLAVQTRKVPIGPAGNPGWLVDVVLAEDFLDGEIGRAHV